LDLEKKLHMAADVFGVLWSMTHIAGDVFVIDKEAIISTMTGNAEEGIILEMNTTIAIPYHGHLLSREFVLHCGVRGRGLLLVVSGWVYDGELVYWVDTKNRVLEPVRNIRSHTFFVGMNWSVSVDSNKVHTIQAGNIYYADLSKLKSYVYNTRAWEKQPEVVTSYGAGALWHNEQPFVKSTAVPSSSLNYRWCRLMVRIVAHTMTTMMGMH
jgi:hypothetical protein